MRAEKIGKIEADPDQVEIDIAKALRSQWLDHDTAVDFRMKLKTIRHPLDRASFLRVIEHEIEARRAKYGVEANA